MPTIFWGLELDPADTGLTLVVQQYQQNGSTFGVPITTGFTELGWGVYLWRGDVNPNAAFIAARTAGGTWKAARGIMPVDNLIVLGDGKVGADVEDVFGNIQGSIFGIVAGDPDYVYNVPGSGPGVYLYPADQTGIAAAVWDRLTSALVTVGSIGKLLVDRIDASISSRAAAGGVTIVTSPVDSDLNITLDLGDTYSATDSRALDWSGVFSSADLTGATVVLTYDATSIAATSVGTGTVVTPTGTQVVRVTLTSAEVTGIGVGSWPYMVRVLLAGRVLTVARGLLTVRAAP